MRTARFLGLTLALAACSPGQRPPDAGPDIVTPDVPATPTRITDLPIESTQRLAGLDDVVEVVVDRHGWPHIYASTLRDAAYVQGLLMARDRMPQMEMLRRAASGTLAEAFGALSPTLIERDIAMRAIGLRRSAAATLAMLPHGRTRTLLEGYAAGVNQHLRDIREGRRRTPNGTELVVNETTPDWTPLDSLTVGRLQALSQGYLTEEELRASAIRDRARETFDEADAETARDRAARRGFFWDFFRLTSASDTVVVPDFYTRTGMSAQYRAPGLAPRLSRATYAAAAPFLDAVHATIGLLGGDDRGSNNFVVAGTHSATGHALLESDPHMALPAPALMWGVHITVKQGPDAVDVAGVAIAGTPGVLLGYNSHVAWGMTNSFLDGVDAYVETITPGTAGEPDTVRFRGRDVPLQTIIERIPNGQGGVYEAPIEVVPHHGPLIPTIQNGRIVPRTGTTAISVRWTGHEPSNELGALVGLMYARNVEEARAALREWVVPPLNFVFADTAGNIGYSTQASIPVRAPGARTWDPEHNVYGTLPCMLLPGTGEAEWEGLVDPSLLPQATNTATRGFIVTANNDPAGNALDNNPLNDRVYLGCRWAFGWRAEQITRRLTALGNRITREDMQAIQNDHTVLAGARFRPFIARALARLEQEWTRPNTHTDLAALATATRLRQARLRDAVARLMAWSLDGASGVDAEATEANRRDAVATTLFHAWLVKFLEATFGDELEAMGVGLGGFVTDHIRATSALALLEHPEQARTYDARTGQSVIWDDLRTADVRETADAVILRALDDALAELERRTATADMERWLWGGLHTVRFTSLVPGPGLILSIPRTNDPMFPNGFPRPGGLDVVDASNPGTNDFDFSYSDGPAQRFTVEMDPTGPRAFNALPGGQAFDSSSRHHRDEAELWRTNRVHPIPRSEAEVVAASERRLRFEPLP